MLRRIALGSLLGFVVSLLIFYVLVFLITLPWWAVLFAVLFWLLWARKRAAAGLDAGPADPSAPAWSPTRERGF